MKHKNSKKNQIHQKFFHVIWVYLHVGGNIKTMQLDICFILCIIYK